MSAATPSATSARAKCVRVGRLPSARIACERGASRCAGRVQPAGDALGACLAPRLLRGECAREAGRGGVDRESEHVDGPPAPARRDLDARDERHVQVARGGRGRPDARHRVVVGERHELHAAGGDVGDQRGRVEHAVGGRGVQVQVDRRVRDHTARGPSPTVSTRLARHHDESALARVAVGRVVEDIGAVPGERGVVAAHDAQPQDRDRAVQHLHVGARAGFLRDAVRELAGREARMPEGDGCGERGDGEQEPPGHRTSASQSMSASPNPTKFGLSVSSRLYSSGSPSSFRTCPPACSSTHWPAAVSHSQVGPRRG